VQMSIGTACSGKANSADFDAIAQCGGAIMRRAPIQVGNVAAPPYANTACNADKAGMIQWTGRAFAACDGTTWMRIASTLYDPTCDGDNPVVGTICDDGTIYAGKTPDGNVKMFVTRCDEGMSWDAATSTCTGAATQLSWQTGATDVNTGITNRITGQANTAALVALGFNPPPAPYLTAQQCDTSLAHAHGDWYLPSENEMVLIFNNLSNAGTANGFNTGIRYSSSTEQSLSSVWSIGVSGSTGSQKTSSFRIRCARKG